VENGGWAKRGPCSSKKALTVAARDARQVAGSERVVHSKGTTQKGSAAPSLSRSEGEAEIETFFGQLWEVPAPHPVRVRQLYPNLRWIR
jgi:hypothetical protein